MNEIKKTQTFAEVSGVVVMNKDNKLIKDNLQRILHRSIAGDMVAVYGIQHEGKLKIYGKDKDEQTIGQDLKSFMESVDSMMEKKYPEIDLPIEEILMLGTPPEHQSRLIVVTMPDDYPYAGNSFLAYPGFLHRMHAKYGNFILSPISTRQVGLTQTSGGEIAELKRATQEALEYVNRTLNGPKEFLSNFNYYFDGEKLEAIE